MRQLARTSLLVLGSIVFVFAVWEIGLSLKYGTDGPHRIVEEFGSPYIHVTPPGTGQANNMSIRRLDDTLETPSPGTFRILSYGDSVGSGYKVGIDEMYAHVIEQNLNEVGRRQYEVLSMVRGNSPTIYSYHIRADVPRFHPDAVIVEIELLNDVSDEAHVETRGTDEDGLPVELLNYRYILTYDNHLTAPMPPRIPVLERTKAYYAATRRLGNWLMWIFGNPVFAEDSDTYYYSIKADRYFLTAEILDRGFDAMFDALAGIHRYLSRRDVAFLLVIVPSQYAYEHERFQPGALRQLARAELRASELGLPYLSLHEAMGEAGGAGLYMDFCHPTAEGNRVMGEAIFSAVRDW